MFVLFSSLALASGEPSAAIVASDAGVHSAVVVAASPTEIKAALADPVASIKLCEDVLSAKIVGQSGGCPIVEVSTRGFTSPLVYTVKRCPTADGWKETLVASDDFDRQEVTVHLEAVGTGTRISMEVHSQPRLPFPKSILQGEVAKSTVQTLRNIYEKVMGR